MSKPLIVGNWTLRYLESNEPVHWDDTVDTRHGPATVEGGEPPHKVSSSGYVHLADEYGHVGRYYAHTINAYWSVNS